MLSDPCHRWLPVTEEVSQVATCDMGHLTCDDFILWYIVCQNGITCDNWCVTGHGLKKMALVHVLTFLSNYDEMSRIIIKCQMVKTDKKLVYRSWLYSTYLGITVMREWQSKISILQPLSLTGGLFIFLFIYFSIYQSQVPLTRGIEEKNSNRPSTAITLM